MLISKKGELSGKKAIALIFLVIGIMLMFFIISQGTSVYKTSRGSTDKQGIRGLQCVGFLYAISGITGTQDELQFTFRNEMGSTEDVHNLTVGDSAGNRQVFPVNISIGYSFSLRVPVRVEENFSVFPDACHVFPASCNLQGECTYK